MKRRVLVTGGAGFIGSHLCKRLLDEGNEVICVDNLFSGSKRNISSLETHSNFSFIEHDICSPFYLEVDEIYNLACPASPIHYQRDPVRTIKVNVLGSINMLDLSKKVGARVLQASTSEVYGNPQVHPQKESYWGNVNPIGLRSCYDEGKRCAETLFFDYYRQYFLDIKVIRIFNTYGPGMRYFDGRVISNFVVQALQGKDITIYGDGSQTRSFCYIDDLIEGIIKMMNTEKGFTGPVNLGNPKEITIRELAEMIIELSRSPSRIVFRELPQDDPERRKPDITLAREKLRWEPRVDLECGLKRTIAYFREVLSEASGGDDGI